MRSRVLLKFGVFLLSALGVLLGPSALCPQEAHAQNQGFQVNRYEPTAAGEWSFWVDHPWYSSTRYFAAGVTLNYGHNPLVFGRVSSEGSFNEQLRVIEHQLIGHVDLAGSFLDRVLLTASLPIVFLERGTAAAGITPNDGVSVGDPRFGLMVRLFGQPYRSAISMSIGGQIWVPLRKFTDSIPAQGSDQEVRGLPKIVIGGLAKSIMWSFTAGVLIRQEAVIGTLADKSGSTVGTELQLGAALAYANVAKRFAIGPEAVLSSVLTGGHAFKQDFTSLEVLLGIHYNIAKIIQLGVGGGVGILRQPGTPDGRVLLRLAYAPIRDTEEKDRDKDGIADRSDACPDEPGIRTDDRDTNGCPDRDGDKVVDKIDLCPDVPRGPRPDPNRLGCPLGDKDGDGVLDPDDQCPEVAKGPNPDPNRIGCPLGDKDSDGVFDPDDLCPDVPQGAVPDPNKRGCPAGDRDRDGVLDPQDQCPDVPAGLNPDPNKRGCPLPDRDGDTVVDPVDACPDKPGAPNPDPKKNGCPGLVEVKGGKIVIVRPVFFATNKDVILAKSFDVLVSVADALKASPQIKRVAVEGHTDDRGKRDYNIELSDRRAKSVVRFLVDKGIDAGRLEAHGYGPMRPVADNKTEPGRAKNRRVDFVILDPASDPSVKVESAANVEPPKSPDQSDKGSKTKKKAAPKKKGKK